MNFDSFLLYYFEVVNFVFKIYVKSIIILGFVFFTILILIVPIIPINTLVVVNFLHICCILFVLAAQVFLLRIFWLNFGYIKGYQHNIFICSTAFDIISC